jgi:hypothetical protein
MRATFYKATRPGLAGLYNRIVRWWISGPYSHVELIFSDGMAASASFMDGGVRFKQIDFDPEHWDFVDLPAELEPAARAWFVANEGKPYDLLGNVGFVWRPIRGRTGAYFCDEAMLAALGVQDPWRFDPCGAYTIALLLNQPASAGFLLPSLLPQL